MAFIISLGTEIAILSSMTDWSKIISTGVGPIIVISACGLLCLALYNRLAAVVTRLRSFHRERMHEQEGLDRQLASNAPDEVALVRHRELLGMLELQTRSVIRRARWIRRTLACFLLTVAFLAACSLCVGLSSLLPPLIYPAVGLFIVGLLLLIAGVVFAMIELKFALDPVELEGRFVRDIGDQMDRS